jgi:hypothetical protein
MSGVLCHHLNEYYGNFHVDGDRSLLTQSLRRYRQARKKHIYSLLNTEELPELPLPAFYTRSILDEWLCSSVEVNLRFHTQCKKRQSN